MPVSPLTRRLAGYIFLLVLLTSCERFGAGAAPLDADVPLHLEEHLDAANLVGSELPPEPQQPVEWRFDEKQPEWKSVGYPAPGKNLPRITYTGDAIRITVTDGSPVPGWRRPHGGIFIDLPDWNHEDWAYVIVRARTSDPVDNLGLGFNEREHVVESDDPFQAYSGNYPVIKDGSIQNYVIPVGRFSGPPIDGPWRRLAVYVGAEKAVTVDILSVTVVPLEANYSLQKAGVRMESRGGVSRRTLYTHAPGALTYHVHVPEAGRLDVGLAVLRQEPPVTFRIRVMRQGKEQETLLEEDYSNQELWALRSLDLSHMEGEVVTIALESESEREGAVTLWGSPTLSGKRTSSHPNVILYIIDGAGADFVSAYGYNRRTTPNLERLAAQGVLFERAFSNSTWSKPSTSSFMTSLHHSVLGGYRGDSAPIPEGATTMAEHLHAEAYRTAVFSSNPYAATLSGLDRGVDVLQETGVEPNNSESSRLLHEAFWQWREENPSEPYWVHFQTTDVHEPYDPVPPFSGLFVTPEIRAWYEETDPKLYHTGGWSDPAAYEKHGIDRAKYSHAQQGLYDEGMAHNDYQIGRLVERLERDGEWEHTLLIIGADHGYPAASHRLMEPLPPQWAPMFSSHETRIPLMFVWPERIAGGRRLREPVSMIDVLPTILDLLNLPLPEMLQGQSLAPLLLGEEGWEPLPVILDEFSVDTETGEFRGQIELIDGRWGASLEINPAESDEIGGIGAKTDERRPVPLLLYDLWRDPYTLESLHEQRPRLAEKYRKLLEARLREHLSLGERFTQPENVAVTSDQLRALQSLGYIQ